MRCLGFSFNKSKKYKHKPTGKIGRPLRVDELMVAMVFPEFDRPVWCFPSDLIEIKETV